MKKSILLLSAFAILLTLSGCFGAKQASVAGRGGEVVGVSGRSFVEPAPYGMVKINRGFLKMGMETQDSLWGMKTPRKDVSVDGFWMDDTEITNISSLWLMCVILSFVHVWLILLMEATRLT